MTKAQQLYLYPDARFRHCSWLVVEEGERHPVQAGSVMEFAEWVSAQPSLQKASLVVFLPVESALHTVVTVPRKQRRFLTRSLPFILEAQTAQDIEELHIVPGPQLPDEQVGVFAIPHRRMAEVVGLSRQLGLQLHQVLLDSQVLAGRQHQVLNLAWHDNRLLISGLGRGMACTRQDVSAWLDRLIPGDQSHVGITLLAGPEQESEAQTLAAELSQSFRVTESAETSSQGWLGMLVDLWLAQSGWQSLLSGPYEPQSKGPDWARYLPVLGTAAGFVVVAAGLYLVADLRQTEARAEATWAAAESIFEQAAPAGITFQRNRYRETAETLLQAVGESETGVSPFMALLADINSAMNEQGVTLEEIRYTGDRNEIQMQIVGDSTMVLERFRDELEARAMSVTYSANRLEGGFRGNYRVQANGGAG